MVPCMQAQSNHFCQCSEKKSKLINVRVHWSHSPTMDAISQILFGQYVSYLGYVYARTTEAQRGNSLHCTAENSLSLPDF